MAALFPTSLPSFTTKSQGETIEEEHINDPQAEIVAIAEKVGTDGDSDQTTHDYMLNQAIDPGSPGHKHTEATIWGTIDETKISRNASPVHARMAENETVTGSWNFANVNITNNYGALPASSNELRIGAGGSTNVASVAWGNGGGKSLVFGTNVASVFTPTYAFFDTGEARFKKSLKVGDVNTSPSAKVHIMASDGSAGTSPLKLTQGTLLGTKEDGAFEYDGAQLYFTVGTTRNQLTNVSFTASEVDFVPGGTAHLVATNVQAAIAEIDSEFLHKSGGSMTGQITLPGDPTSSLQAATKQYVDSLRPDLIGTVNVKDLSTTSTSPVTMLDSTLNVTVVRGTMIEFTISGDGLVTRSSFTGLDDMYVCFELWEGSPTPTVKSRWMTRVPIAWNGTAGTVRQRVPSPRFRTAFSAGSHTFDIRVFVSDANYTYKTPRTGSNVTVLNCVDW